MEVVPTSTEARRFGKYTLVAKLATGGMAEIFLARLEGDGGFEKLVCIKRILPHLARDQQFVSMFLDEARVAARISHPNVCQVFELGEWHGAYYIAMEYLEGLPLSCLRRSEYYPELPDIRLVAGVGVHACEGLHHAHQLKLPDGSLLGVVHRDVSPQNLFLTVDGVVKVLDFGIAKVAGAAKTSTGATKGTYAYMAPEQLHNEKLDRRTDVWALGTVLWETLAQRSLFKRETEFLTFRAISNDPIPDIRELRPDVPMALAEVIAWALTRDRDDRIPSARVLGEQLAQAVAPFGGPLSQAAISDEIERAFAPMLAEQHRLLRIAREGGHFDLETESPLVGLGAQLGPTPVSGLGEHGEDMAQARAEVASYIASHEPHLPSPLPTPRPTPFPGALSGLRPHRPSSMFAVPAPIRYSGTMSVPVVVPQGSKLPWIIALIAVAVAAGTGGALYVTKTNPASGATATVVQGSTAAQPQPSKPPATPSTSAPQPSPSATASSEPTAWTPSVVTPTVQQPSESEPSREPRSSSPPQPPRPPSKPATTATAAPAHVNASPGFITIDSTPVYSVISVDGQNRGETPLVNLALSPGRHVVRAVSETGASRVQTITIESGKTAQAYRIEW
jgi:serine/threonine-protein kinase